jgi:DNA-binding transcriptional regulator YhcF (GntR family)
MAEKSKSDGDNQVTFNPDVPIAGMDDQAVLAFLSEGLDRSSAMPLGAQLRGAIEYGVSGGSLPAGTRLPSIRTLAQATGLAAETVSTAYRALQASGLLVSYKGSGTFIGGTEGAKPVARDELREIERNVDALLAMASRAGLSAIDLVTMIRLRQALPAAEARPVRIAMVGIFEEATHAYAEDIATYLRDDDSVEALTIEQLRNGVGAGDRPDLYVSLPSREREVRDLVGPGVPVTSVSVIPSEKTRSFLAGLDPQARLLLVARFGGFVGLMVSGARAFAPHIRQVEGVAFDDLALAQKLAGADAVAKSLRVGIPTAEYRHTPDPHAIKDILIPKVEALRRG